MTDETTVEHHTRRVVTFSTEAELVEYVIAQLGMDGSLTKFDYAATTGGHRLRLTETKPLPAEPAPAPEADDGDWIAFGNGDRRPEGYQCRLRDVPGAQWKDGDRDMIGLPIRDDDVACHEYRAPRPKADDGEWITFGLGDVRPEGYQLRTRGVQDAPWEAGYPALVGRRIDGINAGIYKYRAPAPEAGGDWITFGLGDVRPEGYQLRARGVQDAPWVDGDARDVGKIVGYHDSRLFCHRAPRPKATEPDGDGWCEHDGSDALPLRVDARALVQALYRDDSERYFAGSEYCAWSQVRRYRVLVPEAQLRRDAEAKAREIAGYLLGGGAAFAEAPRIAAIIRGDA